MARPDSMDLSAIRVTIHYKKGEDYLFFGSEERVFAAIDKMKKDVNEAGTDFVTVTDDYGNTIHFRGSDFVRVTISGPRN